MMHVMRAADLIGLPVVAIDIGEDVAEIRDVVYDSHAHQLIGFTLNKRGRFSGRMKDVLPASALAAIGRDAVMVDDLTVITESETPAALEATRNATSVIGNRVLTEDGNDIGEVVGVVLSTGKIPAAVGYEIDPTDSSDHAFVPISTQMALSDENLLLPSGATAFIRNDLAGFGASVDEPR